MVTTADALLAGPRGRELCSAVAEVCTPETSWWRLSAPEFVAALGSVRPASVMGLAESRLLSELATVVMSARYWQEPEESDRTLERPEVLTALRPVADALARRTETGWWSAPVDVTDQHVVRFLLDDWMPVPDLVDPRPDLRQWRDSVVESERTAGVDAHWKNTTGRWWTSPAFAGIVWSSATRPGLGALKLHTTEDDMGWRRARVHPVDIDPSARIREIHGPEAWARLVDEYPLEVTREKRGDWWRTTGRDGRWWIPDWAAVADDYDAVHVSVLGYLSTAGWAVPTARGATVLAGWGPGHTCWLRPDKLTYGGAAEQWHQRSGGVPVEESAWRRVPADGPDGTVGIRALDEDDDEVGLLTEATCLNVNWTGEERVREADVAADPALAHYTRLEPARGDFGLVAEVGGRPVGVVWLVFLDASDPGYGFVDDGVPELSLCVQPGYRGLGIGGMLLDEAFAAAGERGIRWISLSVENGNPARRLYRDMGFLNASGGAPGTMLIGLRP